jgi:hypothetical protein
MVSREFCGKHDLISIFARGEPFAEPILCLAFLVIVSGVDEVAALRAVQIEDLECCFFAAFSHILIP